MKTTGKLITRNPAALMDRRQFMAALAVGAAGCATPTYPTYQSGAAIGTGRSVSNEGITVTVDPILQKERSIQYFGFYQADGRLVIIHISARNTTRDRSFHLLRKNIRLLPPSSVEKSALGEGKVDRSTSVGEGVAMFGFAALSLPAIFAGAQMIADQTAVRHNMVTKELPEGTLSPGESLEGFVYYQFADKQPSMNGGKVIVTLTEAGSGKNISFPFELNG
ncbi:MAG: hypothetical protein NTY01_01575 [Verrucomicrobia bacterium]|nr:hypothetical protein [Verrucomicrobiota bacterium]